MLAVAELGAELAPDLNQLDAIWERAGGRRKDLPQYASPSVRWQAAARLAQSGHLDGGLWALVEELREIAPNNSAVRELISLLRTKE